MSARDDLLAWLDKRNLEDPPQYAVMWVLANVRHPCPGHRQSTPGRMVQASLYLTEKRRVSDEDPNLVLIYKEGACPKCHATARSRDGWVTTVAERPPIEGRVAR